MHNIESSGKVAVAASIVAGLFLILAIGEWPYAFYQFNRVLVFVAALYLVWYLFDERDKIGWAMAIGIGGLTFNPIAPLTLDQSTW